MLKFIAVDDVDDDITLDNNCSGEVFTGSYISGFFCEKISNTYCM